MDGALACRRPGGRFQLAAVIHISMPSTQVLHSASIEQLPLRWVGSRFVVFASAGESLPAGPPVCVGDSRRLTASNGGIMTEVTELAIYRSLGEAIAAARGCAGPGSRLRKARDERSLPEGEADVLGRRRAVLSPAESTALAMFRGEN